MSAKAVQVSIDEALLRRIDREPEVRAHGRSAFVRAALLAYLRDKRRAQVDEEIARAYGGKADALLDEARPLMEAQAWPKK